MIRQRFTFTGSGEDFGPRADGLITAHTTQSPYNRLTVADAIVLARWQDRSDVAGSYNDLICIDGILECVPPRNASGGINPASSGFKPRAWLYDVMPPEQVRNPNYFTRNVSFIGDMFWFNANGWPPQMVDNFVTVMIEEEASIASRTILTGHEDFQPPPNRFDAGPIANALIRKRYAERTAQEDDDMLEWVQYIKPALFRATIDPGAAVRTAPFIREDTFGFLMPDRGNTIDFIGTVESEAYPAGGTNGLWLVYVVGIGGVRTIHSSQVVGARIPLGIEKIVEKIVEVPVVDQGAIDTAIAALNTRIDAAQRG